jgi:hypothetical protein
MPAKLPTSYLNCFYYQIQRGTVQHGYSNVRNVGGTRKLKKDLALVEVR